MLNFSRHGLEELLALMQMNWRLNRLYPAGFLLETQCIGHCAASPQPVSGHVNDVSFQWRRRPASRSLSAQASPCSKPKAAFQQGVNVSHGQATTESVTWSHTHTHKTASHSATLHFKSFFPLQTLPTVWKLWHIFSQNDWLKQMKRNYTFFYEIVSNWWPSPADEMNNLSFQVINDGLWL